MTWAKFGDGFHNDHRILDLDHASFRLYVCGHTFAQGLLKEKNPPGVMTAAQVRALARQQRVPQSAIGRLVAIGLWEETDGGYRIYKFEKFTPTWRDKQVDGGLDPAKAAAGRASGNARRSPSVHRESTPVHQTTTRGEQKVNPEPEPEPDVKPEPNGSSLVLAGEVHRIYSAWLEVWHFTPQQRRLTKPRADAVRTRLRQFPVETLEDAVRGSVLDSWSERPNQNDLPQLLKPGNVERFRDWFRRGHGPKASSETDRRVAGMLLDPA